MECGPWSFRKGTTRPCWFRTWAPTSCGWPTRGAVSKSCVHPPGMRSKSSGGARMCSDCRSSSRPTALQTGNTRRAHLPLPDHRRERRPLSPRYSQEPAFRRVEGVGNRGRGAGRMPLLFECGERCDIPRFPARVQVQDRIPPHGPGAGTGGDVRQPQQGADARRRGVPYTDADSLRRRCGRRLRDACGGWRTG